MNFLALLPIFSTLIERIFPDKEKQAQANIELQKVLVEAQAQQAQADAAKLESQSKVIVAEANSQSYAARNWRPHLMYCLMATYPVNWILFPILRAFGVDIPALPIPSEYWTVLSIGLGGYIGVDGIRTYSQAKFNNSRFFDTLRAKIFTQGMTQEQVDAINDALRESGIDVDTRK
jgi:hypothetical protein